GGGAGAKDPRGTRHTGQPGGIPRGVVNGAGLGRSRVDKDRHRQGTRTALAVGLVGFRVSQRAVSASTGVMAHRFDSVAVGIAQKGCIVGRVIVAQPGRTVIAPSADNAGVPKSIDLGSRPRLEAPM